MSILYWGLEFAKVLLCYIFVLFIWPSVVFRKFLQHKTKMFRFCFCVTVQIVLINTVVLGLGLLYLLNSWVVRILFYGSFLFSIRKELLPTPARWSKLRKLTAGTIGWRHYLLMRWAEFKDWLRNLFMRLWAQIRPHWLECMFLAAILVYGVIYYGYSPLVDHAYGFGDMYTHHTWIYNLTQGQIFSAGIYPEGMHCVIYLMHTVSGLSIYSCNLFLGCIHIFVYLLSAYFLMREIFRWRYTPLFVLTIFLVVAAGSESEVISLARLQYSLPQEYGLHTQFLCALFLLRFLKQDLPKGWHLDRYAWLKNENLFLFSASLAASIAIHFYVTIMAFFVCLPFAIVFFRRAFTETHLRPLLTAILCGAIIAVIPIAGARLSGIPFQKSIDWALSVMDSPGSEGSNSNAAGTTTPPASNGTTTDGTVPDGTGTDGTVIGDATTDGIVAGGAATTSTSAFARRLSNIWNAIKEKAIVFYWQGYIGLFGEGGIGGVRMLILISLVLAFCLVYRLICVLFHLGASPDAFDHYLPAIGALLLIVILYAAPNLGLPELVSATRLSSTAYLLLLIVAAMPADILFSALKHRFEANWCLQAASAVCVVAICVATIVTGHYHGYLYHEMTRYRSVADVTSSIIQSFPENTYTIISSTDEVYSVIQYGRHEELLRFLQMVEQGENYYLPTEYVFVYVEKNPILHAQYSFNSGPAWLATDTYADNKILTLVASKYPQIFASQISDEYAEQQVSRYAVGYESYRNLSARTVINARANKWCQDFAKLHDHEMKIYYEDDDFICYYFRQNTYSLYDLSIWS